MLVLGIDDGDVHLEIGSAHVVAALIAVGGELLGDILADARTRAHGGGGSGERCPALFGELQERLQARDALGGGLCKVDHGRGHRGKDEHLLPCTRHGDVEAAPAARLVERAEVEGDAPRGIGTVAHREEDDVALVALHVLQVLDEKRLFSVVRRLLQPLLDDRLGEQPFDIVALRARKGDDAHARLGENGVGEPAHDLRDERLRLLCVALCKAAVIGAVHEHELYFAVHRVGRGEGAQLVIVVHAVGEGDEALVLAAVMPQKVPLGHAEGEAVVQDALQVLVFEVILVHIRRTEEGGGRQLFGIAHDDRRLRACNGADRLRRGHLRRLVEDDQVELIGDGLQILRHGGRAHQHAGADDAHERGDLAEQAPQPRAAQIALGKAGECAQFDGEAPLPVLRQAGDELGADMIAREAGKFLPRDAEFFDGLLKRADRHARERGVGGDVDLQEVAVDVLFKAREYVVRAEAPALQRLCDEVESEFGEFFARPAVHAPVGQQVDIVDERARLGGEVV